MTSHKELAFKLAALEGKIEKHDGEIQTIFEAIRQLMASFDKAQDAIPSSAEGWRRRLRSRSPGSSFVRNRDRDAI